MEKTLPIKKFRIGAITASVWNNSGQKTDGQPFEFKSVTFERSYKDKEGAWKNTNSLRLNDLPKAALVLNKAYEFLSFNPDSSNSVSEEVVA